MQRLQSDASAQAFVWTPFLACFHPLGESREVPAIRADTSPPGHAPGMGSTTEKGEET
jgi:hypothetical protein